MVDTAEAHITVMASVEAPMKEGGGITVVLLLTTLRTVVFVARSAITGDPGNFGSAVAQQYVM